MAHGTYADLLTSWRFQAFLWTQFLGAFNDNVSKWIVTLYAIDMAAGQSSLYAALVGGVFVLPFLLFSSHAGYVADVYAKRSVLMAVKMFEIAAMGLGFFAISSGNIVCILLIPFLMGLHSTFFAPAKYGILPEILPDQALSRANGLLEMTTFMAIILGTSLGGLLYAQWKGQPGLLNLVLVSVALLGALCSFGIPRVPPSGAQTRFRCNPYSEISTGLKTLRCSSNLWQTALGLSYFWLLGAFLLTVIAPLGKDVMALDDRQTAMLEAFLALGIGIGSLVAGKLSGDKVELGLVPIGSLGMGVCAMLVARAVHYTYYEVLLLLALLGFFGGFFVVPLNALLQQKSGKDEKGRILATNSFMNALGMILAFALLSLFGGFLQLSPDRSILVMSGLTFGVSVYLLTVLPDFLVRFSLWLLTHSLYRIKIVGQDNVPRSGPALLVCNHVSLVDGLLVGASIQRFVRFLVYQPYYAHPAFHWLFKLMHAIPVSNRSRAEVAACLEQAREALQAGHVVCIFAEGAISRTGNMLPFKRGFERIIQGLDVPIIPVHLDRLWGSIFSFQGGRFVTKWPQQVPWPVTVSYGTPLPAAAKAYEVRQAVQALASDAMPQRQTRKASLPYRFVKTARRQWSSFCLADASGQELTYGQTLTAGLLVSGWLNKHCPDKMVGLLLPASVGGALANLGVALAGKVSVNLNFTAGKAAMASAIEQCGLSTILTSRVFLAKAHLEPLQGMLYIEEIFQAFGPLAKALTLLQACVVPTWLLRCYRGRHWGNLDDLATVLFSSGSTGIPKGVMLSHTNVLANLEACRQLFWVTPADRVLGILPFFHAFGFMGTLWLPLVAGFGAVYHANPLDAKVIGALTTRYKATLLISTPTFYATYIRQCSQADFASLRFAIAGAEKLRPTVARDFQEKFGIELLEGYGCTEMSPVIAVNVPDFQQGRQKQQGMKPGTVGQPLPGVALQVVHPESGEVLPPNQEGLLLVKGPNRMLGYLGQPEKTAASLRHGWYVTGDMARLDEDGFLRITDRLSRFSKIGGEMVPHGKIEEVLNASLGEYPCAVTAIPDAQKGEKLVLLYTDPQVQPQELWQQLAHSELPRLWIPKQDSVYFVDKLPLLGSGKLDVLGLQRLALQCAVLKNGL